jgi:hypothetical protein
MIGNFHIFLSRDQRFSALRLRTYPIVSALKADAAAVLTISIVEDASLDTVQTDLQRLKTIGTIKVVVRQARRVQELVIDSSNGVPRQSSARVTHDVAQKALILDDRGHTHATKYRTDNVPRIHDHAFVGEFHFHYLSRSR